MPEQTPEYGIPYLGKDDTLKETTSVAEAGALAYEAELKKLNDRIAALEAGGGGGGGSGGGGGLQIEKWPDFEVTREYMYVKAPGGTYPWNIPEWQPGRMLQVSYADLTGGIATWTDRGYCHPLDVNGDVDPIWKMVRDERQMLWDRGVVGTNHDSLRRFDRIRIGSFYKYNETRQIVSYSLHCLGMFASDTHIKDMNPFSYMSHSDGSSWNSITSWDVLGWQWSGLTYSADKNWQMSNGDVITVGSYDITDPPEFPGAIVVSA